jgi:hypothetical protein
VVIGFLLSISNKSPMNINQRDIFYILAKIFNAFTILLITLLVADNFILPETIKEEYFNSIIPKKTYTKHSSYTTYAVLSKSGAEYDIPNGTTLPLVDSSKFFIQKSKLFHLNLRIRYNADSTPAYLPIGFLYTNISIQLVLLCTFVFSMYALTAKKISSIVQDISIAASLFFYLGFCYYVFIKN